MQTKDFFKTLNIIWLALLGGQFIFFVVTFVVDIPPNEGVQGLIEYIGAAMLASTVPLSTIFYQSVIKRAAKKPLEQQLNQYRQGFIIKMALLEGGVLFCIVAYMLTKTMWLLPLIIGGIVWQFMQAPSRKQFIEDFEISGIAQDEVPQT